MTYQSTLGIATPGTRKVQALELVLDPDELGKRLEHPSQACLAYGLCPAETTSGRLDEGWSRKVFEGQGLSEKTEGAIEVGHTWKPASFGLYRHT